jgi:hypothetical protein
MSREPPLGVVSLALIKSVSCERKEKEVWVYKQKKFSLIMLNFHPTQKRIFSRNHLLGTDFVIFLTNSIGKTGVGQD